MKTESLWRDDSGRLGSGGRSGTGAVLPVPRRHIRRHRGSRRRHRHGGARARRSGCPRNGASRSSSRTRAAARTSSARSRWRTQRPTATRVMLAEAGTFVINPNLYPKDKLPIDIEKDFVLDHRPGPHPSFGDGRAQHAGEQRGRADRAREAEARRDHLRHRRRRLRPACQRRALRERRQGQAQRHPLPRRDARAERRHGRPHQHDDGQRQPRAAGAPRRQGQDAQHRQRQAPAAAPGVSDHRGSRQPAGLHRRHLVRAGGHRRNAAPDRRQDQRRRARDPGRTGVQGAVPRPAVLRDGWTARRRNSGT